MAASLVHIRGCIRTRRRHRRLAARRPPLNPDPDPDLLAKPLSGPDSTQPPLCQGAAGQQHAALGFPISLDLDSGLESGRLPL